MDTQSARRRLERQRQRLVDLRDDEVSVQEADRRGGQELSSYDQHDADAATELHDREVEDSIIDGLDTELAEVDAALERIEEGAYGRCEVCGRTIADERLDAVPATRVCARHQAANGG